MAAASVPAVLSDLGNGSTGTSPPSAAPGAPWHWDVEVLHDAREQGLGRHSRAWDALNARLTGGHPMLSAGFVNHLLRHFAPRSPALRLAIAPGPAGAPRAMLLTRPQLGGLFWHGFLPAQMQLGPALLPAEVTKPDLGALLRQLAPQAISLDLLSVDPSLLDLGHGPLGRAAPPGRDLPHALTMTVALSDGFDAYWAQRPASLRQNIRRYFRRAASEKQMPTLTVHTAAEVMGAAVQRYAELESQSWKGRLGTAVTPGSDQAAFYADLLTAAALADEAMVFELHLGERLAAMRLALRHGSRVVMLKTTFDKTLERFAPGRLLLHETLLTLARQVPDCTVEFCTHADPDMLAWASSSRWVSHWAVRRNPQLAFDARAFNRLRRVLVPARGPRDPEVEVRQVATLDELPADARALLDGSEPRSIQFGSDWYRALIDAVYRNGEACWLVQQRGGHTQAVLPLAVTRSDGRAATAAALANFYTAVYEPALQPGLRAFDLVPLARALRQLRPASGQFTFSPMAGDGASFKVWYAALSMVGLVPFGYFAFGNWYLNPPDTWDAYLASLPGKARHTLRRKGKQFEEMGGRLEIVKEAAALPAALAAFEQVYAKSWKVAEPYPDFMPALVRRFAARGALRIGVAWLGDLPVAAQFWFVHAGRADIYKVAYDEAYSKLSVGTLMTGALLREAIEVDRVQEVDYLIGDDPYKKTWMRGRRERWGIVAYDPFVLRGFVGLLRESAGRIARHIWPRRGSAATAPAATPADGEKATATPAASNQSPTA